MKKLFLFLITSILLSSCSEKIARGLKYPKMYDEKPTSIVIMPPINQTSNVEAKEYFYTTLYAPLCEKGYYVFSPYMTLEMFEGESAYDSEMFINGDLSTFKKVLNADAAMFTVIKSWRKNVIGGSVVVEIEYILKSTITNEILYQRDGQFTLNTSVSTSGGGLIGLAVSMAATAINTAITEHVEAGRQCNVFVLSDMPAGKYSPLFGVDKDMKVDKR